MRIFLGVLTLVLSMLLAAIGPNLGHAGKKNADSHLRHAKGDGTDKNNQDEADPATKAKRTNSQKNDPQPK